MEKLIEKLNAIFSIQKPLEFDNEEWERFKDIVETCHKKGYNFKHLSFDIDTFNRYKNGKENDTISTIEALCYSIEKIESQAKNDPYYQELNDFESFIHYRLIDLKRERDFQFAELLDAMYFKNIDKKTIQYASCINAVYDYKIKHIINSLTN